MSLEIASKTVNKVEIIDFACKVKKHLQIVLAEGYDDADGDFVPIRSVGTIFINGDDLAELASLPPDGNTMYDVNKNAMYSFLIDKGYIIADGQTVTIQYATTTDRVKGEAGVE